MSQTPPTETEHSTLAPTTQVSESQTQWMPHPGIASWSNSREMVILIEGTTTFRVDFGRLQKYSETIREIFALPTDISNEGTPENPVIISGFTVNEFAYFMEWFDNIEWRSQNSHNLDENFLLGVLTVCDKWLIDHGKTWAVNELNLLKPALPSARRLNLAQRLRIPEFVRPAVHEIMTRTVDGKHIIIRAISDDEIDQMGWRVYAIIARAHEALDLERALMALVPPPLSKGRTCQDHARCMASFTQGWTKEMLPQLIGKNAQTLSNIQKNLAGTLACFPRPFEITCKIELTQSLQSPEHGYFKAEQMFINAAVDKILQVYQLN